MLPAANILILKRSSRNMGSLATRSSIQMKAASRYDAEYDAANHQRIAPAHRRVAVRLDTIGDAKQQHRQPDREGDVAEPVDLLFRPNRRRLAQHHIGPNRAGEANGDAHQKDETPVIAASTPPRIRPMNEPAMAAIWLIPSARPR